MKRTTVLPPALAAVLVTLGAACSSTASSAEEDALPDQVAVPAAEVVSTTTTPTAPPPAPVPDAPAPTSEPPTPQPVPTIEPALAAPEPAPCGEYGPLPPLPDSMDPHFLDTDGNGLPDDAVTVYADATGWKIRNVSSDGVVSETAIVDAHDWTTEFALVLGPVHFLSSDADHVLVQQREGEYKRHQLFALTGDGCIHGYGDQDPPPLSVGGPDDGLAVGLQCAVVDGTPQIYATTALRDGDGNWEVWRQPLVTAGGDSLDYGTAGPDDHVGTFADGDPIVDSVATIDCTGITA